MLAIFGKEAYDKNEKIPCEIRRQAGRQVRRQARRQVRRQVRQENRWYRNITL